MKSEVRDLAYFMALPYTIEIFPDTEVGGFVARIKELRGCMTQADTWEQLKVMLDEAKEGWLETALESGRSIPEPQAEIDARMVS
jgi:antitoxin HicB